MEDVSENTREVCIKTSIAGLVALALIFPFARHGCAQQAGGSDSGTRASLTSRHYSLPATPENVQWGWYDPAEKPKLVINSGDTVSIETLSHSLGRIRPGVDMDAIVKLRKENDGGGPHSITGPIFVSGAEPGDTLEIRILKIVPKPDAFNFNLPGKEFPAVGLLAPEFPEGFVRYYNLDLVKMQTQFKPGIVIDLQPFPGTFAVGVDPNEPAAKAGPPIHDSKGRTSTLRPWKNGSNMDLNELQVGSTLYLPVFLQGGLIWTGDSHCAQGNGEVNLTAVECSFQEIRLQPIVRKDLKLTWPRIETKTHFIQVGFDEDLMKAFTIALNETVDFLTTSKGLDRYEAYSLASIAADCRISQVVDVRKGVHCMVPKSIFTASKTATR